MVKGEGDKAVFLPWNVRVPDCLGLVRKAPMRRAPLRERAMPTYICLLRGINVSGKNMISMKALKPVLEALGFTDVQTYLQSGNVVFRDGARTPGKLASKIQAAITESFGITIPVHIIPGEMIAKVVAGTPHPEIAAAEPKKYHVTFLYGQPTPETLAAFKVPEGDKACFVPGDGVLYVHFPDGAGTTKLTPDYMERRLKVSTTTRNWNTVLALAKMVEG